MDANLSEQENLLNIQENYFKNLLELGISLEKSGQHQKAIDVFKKGIENAENAKGDFLGSMMFLVE